MVILFFCALAMCITGIFCIKPSSAQAETLSLKTESEHITALSELTDKECVDFIVSRGVEIPSDFIGSPDLGNIVKEIIQTVEYNPACTFIYSYDVTLRFANDIKNVVNEYYATNNDIDKHNIATYAGSYSLQDSSFYSNSGYMNYNCYAFSINRNENPPQYSSSPYINYQPGVFSGQSFNINLSISQIAQMVKDDMVALGYSNISISTECVTSFTRRTICVRKGSSDYHFMRYENSESAWLHKPGLTSILKYNSYPSNDVVWRGEYVDLNGNAGITSTTYTSTIYYISYDYFGGGTGTTDDPFLIYNPEHFRNMEFVYKQFYETYQGYEKRIAHSFKLINNIELYGNWQPFAMKFAGEFDGNSKYIKYNMNITEDDGKDYYGLFGFCSSGSSGAVIKNLTLKDCVVKVNIGTLINDQSAKDVGILAGALYKSNKIENLTILNPTIDCNVPNAYTGGIAGYIEGTKVINCVVSNGSITAYNGPLGGMAGAGDLYYFQGGSCSTTLIKENYSDDDKIGDVIGNSTETGSVICSNTIKRNKPCVTTGSLITLADGRQVPVESLTGNEMLLVWDLTTGTFDSAPILFIDSDAATWYSIVNLTFSDGTNVQIINEHGFWDVNLNKYVYLREDAANYIGHWFNKQAINQNGNLITKTVQLTNVEITREYTVAYSPVTFSHFCYYVNGLLSMPGGIDGLFNIFEVNPETMCYDKAQMLEDIEQYGIFTYEEFAEIVPVPEKVFEAFNGQYLKVAIGKGLVDIPTLQELALRYAKQLENIG